MSSLYYEDFPDGREFFSRGRTITEADVVAFAALSGDFIELHTNQEYARQSMFGRRLAHGALIFSVSTGLTAQMNLVNDTVLAFYGLDRLRFTRPVFLGDTVRVRKRVLERQDKGPDKGVVAFETAVLNQRDEPVIVYQDRILLRKRGA
jgi:acyl dehydratase